MTTFTVTNLNDSGAGSLREAVTVANLTAGNDSIVFQAGLTGNIALQSSLVLTSNIFINGDSNGDAEAEITLTDAGATGALVLVNSDGSVNWNSVNIANSTVDSGASAIDNNGSISINYSVISNNKVLGVGVADRNSAAIANKGTMTMYQSLLFNNSSIAIAGSNGSNAVNGTIMNPSSGSTATSGQDGGSAASILNFTGCSLTLVNSAINGGRASAGNGGKGGDGVFSQSNPTYEQGRNGGNGGSAAAGVLNAGTMSGTEITQEVGGILIADRGLGGLKGLSFGFGGPTVNGANGLASNYNSNFGSGTGALAAIAAGTQNGDTVTNIAGGVTFFGLNGNDDISGVAGAKIYGGAGNDILTSNYTSAATFMSGGAGNDTLRIMRFVANANNSGTWNGGGGIDTFDASGQTLTDGLVVDLADGTNNFGGTIANFENVIGTNLSDNIRGSSDDNVLKGGGGNDLIRGGAGADTLDGGTNTAEGDTLSYVGSLSGVNINLGNNTASSGDAAGDVILNFENVTGSAQGDQLIGDGNANVLTGGAGNDLFVGGLGADRMIGGDDLDVVDYSAYVTGVFVNLTTGTATGGDTLSQIENIIGSALGDVLDGDNGANTMRGGAGNDFMVAGNGADLLIGGADNDEVSYATATTGVFVNLTTGVGANGGVLQEIENIRGSNSGDVLQGDNGANTIRGLDGNDFIIAGNGADLLIGGNDNDTVSYETATAGIFANLTTGIGANGGVLQEIENLTGSNFGDVLIGSALGNTLKGGGGNDYLVGNAGSDALYGGADNDIFRFETTTFGNDVIADFQDNGDKLSFASAVATNFNQFNILNNNTTNVTLQIAGQSIVMQGLANISLTASDFLFV